MPAGAVWTQKRENSGRKQKSLGKIWKKEYKNWKKRKEKEDKAIFGLFIVNIQRALDPKADKKRKKDLKRKNNERVP